MNETDETEPEANIDIDIGNNDVLDGGIQGDVDPKRNFEPALNNALDRICFNVSKFTPAFLTPDRIKIVIIVLVLAIAAFMFTSSTPSEGLYKNLLASASSDFPHYHTVNITNGRPEYLRVYISGQEINTEKSSKRIKVMVHLQEQQSENKWKTITPNVLSITLKKDEEKNEVRILKVPEAQKEGQFETISPLRLLFNTTSHSPIGFSYDVITLPGIVRFRIGFAVLVLIGVYGLIAFEVVHRTIAAMFGAFVALAILSKVMERPSLPEVAGWIDYNTCSLLFGMMIMVGLISQTGCFEWAAVKMYRYSKGNIWTLLVGLSLLVGVLSAFLDNVTTILLLAPVSLKLCKVLKISPYPILLTEIMFTNLGGTATAIGDPPNIIIVSDPEIEEAGTVTFGSFLIHMGPATILSCVAVLFYVRYIYKDQLSKVHHDVELMAVPTSEEEEDEENDPEREEQRQKRRERDSSNENNEEGLLRSEEINQTLIESLEETYVITDIPLFISSCIVLGFVILLFFIHGAIELHLSMSWIAIIGAMVHILVAGVKNIEEVLEKVEWGTLLFFGALFVLMKALDELGLMDFFADFTADVIAEVDEGKGREAVAIILILWVSAFVSAFIDNIPFTTAMVPVINRLYSEANLNLPLTPMVWALAFGVCFGGNATIIGASANVVAVGIAEKEGYHVTFKQFFKFGMPVMLISCSVSTVFLLIFNVAFAWHEPINPSSNNN